MPSSSICAAAERLDRHALGRELRLRAPRAARASARSAARSRGRGRRFAHSATRAARAAAAIAPSSAPTSTRRSKGFRSSGVARAPLAACRTSPSTSPSAAARACSLDDRPARAGSTKYASVPPTRRVSSAAPADRGADRIRVGALAEPGDASRVPSRVDDRRVARTPCSPRRSAISSATRASAPARRVAAFRDGDDEDVGVGVVRASRLDLHRARDASGSVGPRARRDPQGRDVRARRRASRHRLRERCAAGAAAVPDRQLLAVVHARRGADARLGGVLVARPAALRPLVRPARRELAAARPASRSPAIGIALAAAAPSYWLVLVLVVVSGLGVAAYHPEGSKFAAYASGQKRASGMSAFSIGGNIGFALGPIVATPLVLWFGLRGGLLLALPPSRDRRGAARAAAVPADVRPRARRSCAAAAGREPARARSRSCSAVIGFRSARVVRADDVRPAVGGVARPLEGVRQPPAGADAAGRRDRHDRRRPARRPVRSTSRARRAASPRRRR